MLYCLILILLVNGAKCTDFWPLPYLLLAITIWGCQNENMGWGGQIFFWRHLKFSLATP